MVWPIPVLYNRPMSAANRFLISVIVMTASLGGTMSSASTPPRQVGAAMALLATLEDAQVLPPEGTPEANRVVKIVIQFQSAFMKSEDDTLREFFRQALLNEFGDQRGGEIEASFPKTGWTAPVLGALVKYRHGITDAETGALASAFSRYNVTTADFDYLLTLFQNARLAYRARGQDIETVFAERRRRMPGAS
ncbi:MAG TPA: hypothetical protein VFS39_15840 [Nitrospira sp.]|nr:hypothetical protein [Nitrospira sp.]